MEIILASASVQRKELLKKILKEFKIVSADIDENTLRDNTSPSEIAETLALKKAEEISERYPESLVVGADTVVELDGVLYGKPENEAEAIKFLKKFRGTVQQVITGVAILCKEKKVRLIDSEITQVKMRADISDEEIKKYAESGEGNDKAGSYAVQEKGDKFVQWLKGDYYNVVGLPLEKLRKMLEEAKERYDLEIDLIYNKNNVGK